MFGRLIKWLVTMLFITVAGTLIGWVVPIIITATPLWCLVAGMMVVAIVLFKFTVWCIEHGGW